MAPEIPIEITRGRTFEYGFLYADDEQAYLPITGMPSVAPVRLTVAGHNIPDGWPISIVCVKAPQELNTAPDEPEFVTVVDVDTIELNNLNAHCWKTFSGSGLVAFSRPADLTGWQARAQVRDRINGTVLFTWHSDPDEEPDGELEVDIAGAAFVLRLTDEQAAALSWRAGVYDVEVIAPGGESFPLVAPSPISVVDVVTK